MRTQVAALSALQPAMATAAAEIAAHVAALATAPEGEEAREGHDFFAMERRRLLAEGCCAAGLIGHRAALADEEGTALAALEALLPVLTSPEPAEGCPSFMWAGTVQNNGGCALLRLFSDARLPELAAPIAPVFRFNDDRYAPCHQAGQGSTQHSLSLLAVMT